MSQQRSEVISVYRKLREYAGDLGGVADVGKYYEVEVQLARMLGDHAVILDDGETCIHVYDSSIVTRRLMK